MSAGEVETVRRKENVKQAGAHVWKDKRRRTSRGVGKVDGRRRGPEVARRTVARASARRVRGQRGARQTKIRVHVLRQLPPLRREVEAAKNENASSEQVDTCQGPAIRRIAF